ncbi:hypothetical protein CALCODRAFT_450060 [Calocera cornea HHB12733]|uniref:ZZ-type domain-containing protein n=1 Tax=Calocera cornea HHB12733 TaxID=1353952 RepID=A0A165HLE3_9BASI|nr:hypothetical protein CALCODRAFT_450060 [Calocera cornea HHB12733]
MTALSSQSSAWDRPDRPLVVKCSYNRSMRRVTFASAVDCSFDVLRAKVEQCYSLYGCQFLITYMDDDGEVTDISSNHDLTEAINYFSDGDTESVAYSGASSASGRSSSGKKVTLRVRVNMENDGPSLSDTASLASMDEYVQVERAEQRREIPRASGELEDDVMTVSSHNYGSQASSSFVDVPRQGYAGSSAAAGVNGVSLPNYNLPTVATVPPSPPASPRSRRFQQNGPFDEPSETTMAADRLRRLVVANGSDPRLRSDDDGADDEDPFDDAQLELQRGTHHYYYEYPASQSGGSSGRERAASQRRVRDSGMDQSGSVDLESLYISNNQQTSPHGLAWIENQNNQLGVMGHARLRSSPGFEEHLPLVADHTSSLPMLQNRYPGIPAEVLAFVPEEEVESLPAEAPRLLTDCSACGVLLEDFRYVCTTCGEKEAKEPPSWHPLSGRQVDITDAYSAYSEATVHQSHSGSSIQLQDFSPRRQNGYPFEYRNGRGIGRPGLQMPTLERGYELCAGCVHSAGLNHATLAAEAEGPSPLSSSSSSSGPSPLYGSPTAHFQSSQSSLQLAGQSPSRMRKKHAFRHAFREKMWGPTGWKDLEYDEHVECATCKNPLPGDRYKCLSCDNFSLCRGCYSQVHHIHPAHVFLFVEGTKSEPATPSLSNALVLADRQDSDTLDHPGVKCTHCLQDIVGARFHCAICTDVDICANCEAAGLPGNLTAPDGGHDDSHIMIKIPYPLDSAQVEAASRRARNLWSQRDGINMEIAFPRQRSNSSSSDSLPTVIGAIRSDEVSKHIICKGCDELIEGVRYQCAHCPSLPESYSLCSMCEARSYDLHDPMHAFFKIPRPLDRAINSPFPILPLLYRSPVAAGFESNQDPRAYLLNLVHGNTLCDICVEPIRGEWFRCVYCSKDLCADCEENDVHDPTHIFVVFKAPVDMNALKVVTDIANPRNSRPLLPFQVYGSGGSGP